MNRPDWLNIAVWSAMGILTGAFWSAVIALLLLPFASGALETVGKLNGCEAYPTECHAYAQERSR